MIYESGRSCSTCTRATSRPSGFPLAGYRAGEHRSRQQARAAVLLTHVYVALRIHYAPREPLHSPQPGRGQSAAEANRRRRMRRGDRGRRYRLRRRCCSAIQVAIGAAAMTASAALASR